MKTKNDSEAFYDTISKTYDKDYIDNPDYKVEYLKHCLDIMARQGINSGSILDVGCGTGILGRLADGNFDFTGIDISSGMLSVAKRNGYQILHAPLEEAIPEIDSKSFVYVICLGALMFCQQSESLINHFRRIAIKGIILSLDDLESDYIKQSPFPAWNHSKIIIEDAVEDYIDHGWISPSHGLKVKSRYVYIRL